MNKWREGLEYANAVIDGEILACEDVRLACERFIRMLTLAEDENNPFKFSTAKVEHILKFANSCVHVKGPDVGKRFILAPWQVFFICGVFGFVWRDTELRIVTDVILFVPRKSGKSFLISLIACYLLIFPNGYRGAPEGGTEIYVTAIDRDQAGIVFTASQGLIDSMPKELASQYKLYKSTLHKADDRLSIYRTLSRDSKKNAVGKGASVHIVDEAAMVLREPILAVDSGMVHRLAPLRVCISTAHHDRQSLFFERMNYCSSVLRGSADDTYQWFSMMYSVPDGMEWDDPAAWKAVNPMLGINVPMKVYENLCTQAKEMFSVRNEFLCRNLNYWVSAEAQWMAQEVWDALPDTIPEGEPDTIAIGIDLAMTRDLNSVALLKRYGDQFYLTMTSFLPEDGMRFIPLHNLAVVEKAIADKHLILTEGNVTDYGAIFAHISQLCAENDVTVIGYDPYNASGLLLLIQESLSVPLQAVGQGIQAISAPAKEFYQMCHEGRIHTPKIPFHSWCLAKCTLHEDINGNWKVRKCDEGDKIDPIIASIIATKCLMDRPVFSGSGFFML